MIVAISSEMPLYVICRKLEYAAGASGVDINKETAWSFNYHLAF